MDPKWWNTLVRDPAGPMGVTEQSYSMNAFKEDLRTESSSALRRGIMVEFIQILCVTFASDTPLSAAAELSRLPQNAAQCIYICFGFFMGLCSFSSVPHNKIPKSHISIQLYSLATLLKTLEPSQTHSKPKSAPSSLALVLEAEQTAGQRPLMSHVSLGRGIDRSSSH